MPKLHPKDRIAYTEPFLQGVGGRLYARFRLDASGDPIFEKEGRLRHYVIDLFLATPRANEVKRVRYEMNDPSFDGDSWGTSEDADNCFPLEISSYGDVEVLVTVVMKNKDEKYTQRAWLSQMLENGHAHEATSPLRDAILRIAAN